jgi:hypothetical protein
MASAAESELAALFITAREIIPHRQTLIGMGWPHPNLLSKLTTLLLQGLPTTLLFLDRAK